MLTLSPLQVIVVLLPTSLINPKNGGSSSSDQAHAPHQAIAPSAVASVAVPPVGVAHNTLRPPHAPASSSAGRHGGSSPSTSSLLTPSPGPRSAHDGTEGPSSTEPSPPRFLTNLSHRRRSTRSISPSPSSSQLSHSSLSSRYSLLPLRTFQRLHLLVFALTFLFLFLLPVALLIVYKREIGWKEFGLGVGSWLAGETLREVIFELFTFGGGGRVDGAVRLPLDGEEEESVRRSRSSAAASRVALPSVIHSVAQELLRLGAVALAVALLPPSIFSSFLSLSSSFFATSQHSSSSSPSRNIPSRPPPRRPLPPLDPLFFSVLWLALGWAVVEILWGSRRVWKQLELYEDVLGGGEGVDEEDLLTGVPRREQDGVRGEGEESGTVIVHGHEEDEHDDGHLRPDSRQFVPLADSSSPLPEPDEHRYFPHPHHDYPQLARLPPPPHSHDGDEGDESDSVWDEEDEEEFQARLREVQREELEAQLGVPLYEIPVGVVLIWRIDSILLSLLFTLLLSLPFRLTPPSLFAFPLWPTFLLVSSFHALLSLVWVMKVTKWGVPAISYASLLVLVLGCFGALGAWGVLE
ncbi:hypothetical protein JCM8547_001155 [Rhodosporidiobolus lusitaniae]